MISDNGDKPVSKTNDEQEFDPFALEPEHQAGRSRGAGVAWLALVLAVLVAAFSGYREWREWRQGAAGAEQAETRLDAVRQAQARLSEQVTGLQEQVSGLGQDTAGQDVERLARDLAGLRGQIAQLDSQSVNSQSAEQALQAALFDLQQSLAALEGTVAAVAAREQSAGQQVDLLEVEALLRMASERLQLFGNPPAADRALALADERLAAMDDPVYLSVRQRISLARQALEVIELPDRVELDGRIAALQARIPALPFQGDAAPEPAADPVAAEGLWARVKQALAGLVTVRRRAPDDPAVLSLDDRDYLRQGLWLQLETARLSLMRRDAAAFTTSLGRAADTAAEHFDARGEAVRRFTAEIENLQATRIEVEMPDISAPWGQLRLLRQRAEQAGRVQPAAADATATGPAAAGDGEVTTEESAGQDDDGAGEDGG